MIQENIRIKASRHSLASALALGITLSLATSYSVAQSSSPSSANSKEQLRLASSAAEHDFKAFVEHHLQSKSGTQPAGFPLDVTDIQNLKTAKIAYGFQVYTIDPKDILSARADMRSMAKATGIWRFVINLEGKPIGLATVEQVNGKWETVAYGGAILAQEVDASIHAYGNTDHSNVRFIRIYQAQSDFLEVSSAQDAKTMFAPLLSARQSLLLRQGDAKSESALVDGNELLGPLQAAVKKNMGANN
ncbi:hypothetical protein [Massilia sp. BJB1822]|uniref:hypothetical protein n=1 Tax=Massilia sp. BJB1822 TaxID=2744470 RepID=UPI001592C0F0|nr:hypothetical protein [Massilia sp. BJB1822]NVE01224.1 hypothetical protein [Massilia sp. BJB1822]